MKTRVAVIFGGRSGEHEVSLASATSIMNNLDRSKYEVLAIGIAKDGRWLLGGDPMKALTAGQAPEGHEPTLLSTTSRGAETALAIQGTGSSGPMAIDVAFPVLHGPFGEDGTVQGLLEIAGVPYVGAGVLASAAGMDKAIMKSLFVRGGLPVPEHLVVMRREWEGSPESTMDRAEAELGFPCFVKPANLGSSVGVTKAHDRNELAEALGVAAKFDRKLLVERGIDAREIECSVLGNDDPIASVPGEILPAKEFYDYEAKYVDEGSQLVIPAKLPRATTDEIRRLAIEAFKAIDCAGMARVDFFLERPTGRVLVNEINTIPGFTKISMYPKLWEASGIPYAELLDRLIELAIERHAEKLRNQTTYQP